MTSRLELTPRSAEITLTSDPSLHKRYRARFEGQAPRVDVRLPPCARRGRGAEIAVDPSVPWEVDVRGGVSRLSGDLTPVELGSLEIDGGVSKSALRLGRPTGRVVVRIRGGVSDLSIHRPADVPVRLRVRGGASRISLDEQRLGAAGGEVRLASLTDVGTADRYEIEIHGGASKLTVATDLT
jgi:hypothetical protein